MLRPLFQGFTPLAIACRPFGAPEAVLLFEVAGNLGMWQGAPEAALLLKWQGLRKVGGTSGAESEKKVRNQRKKGIEDS